MAFGLADKGASMKVTENQVKSILITDVSRLDPIRVYWQDFGKDQSNKEGGNRGMLTFVCYGDAWSVYWPAMGDNTIVEFFIKAGLSDAGYVFLKMVPQHVQYTDWQRKYIERIIKTVANGLKKYLKEGGKK